MIKIGVIGAGYWGPKLIRNFSEISEADIRLCTDLKQDNLTKLKSQYPGLNTSTNYREIMENPEIEAVIIATPVSTHFPLAKEALLNNKHVLIEKPMTSNSQQAEELVRIAGEKNRVLMVDHTYEYSPEIRKIREIVQGGELGEIYTINMARLSLGLYQPDNVNVVTDLIPHDISILNYILGKPPVKINAFASRNFFDHVEDDAHINLQFDGKASANVHVSWIYPKKIRTMSIVGRRKMLFYDAAENPGETIRIYDKGIDFGEGLIEMSPKFEDYIRALKYRYGDIHVPKIETYEPLKKMCLHFLECIRDNKKPQSDGTSGLNVVRVIEQINNSLKQG